MKKKLSALFMVFAMVLSLFSGLGVNTVWADVNEEEGGDTKEVISGLAAMDWLEWDDNGNIIGSNEQATWMKGLGSVVNGTTLLVKELDETGKPTGDAIQAEALTLAYCGNGEEPNDSPQTENVGSIAPVENNANYVQLKFSYTGWYKLYLTDRTDSDEITIEVGYKDLGFYTTDTKTPEGAIDSYDYTSEKDGVIYLITSAPEGVTWDGNETWQVNVDGNENIDENLYSKYFTKTLASPDNSSQEKVYKLTLKKGAFERLDICVKANGTFNGDTWTPEEWLNVHYEGKMSGLRVSNNMEDISDEGGRECFSQVIYPLHRFMAWQEDGTEKIYRASELAVEAVDGTGTAVLKDSEEQKNAVEISVSDAGDYKVYVKDDSTDYVTIHMSYPESAYYTTENPSVDGLLDGSVNYTYNSTKSGNVLYFIANIPEDVTEIESEWYVSTNAGDVAKDDIERYVSIKEIERGKFKLTLKDTTEYLYLLGKVHQPGFDPDHGKTEGWGTASWLTTQFTGSSAGFSVTQNFHWDDNAGHMVIDDKAHYTKEGWGSLNHQQTYQFARVAKDGSVEKVYKKDELTIEPMTDATGTASLVQPDDYIRIKFNGTGEYKIYAKENPDDAVIVSADFNKVGLYTAEKVSADTVCDSESTIWKDECNVLYVIPYGVDENLTPNYKFFVEPADENRSYDIADFYTVEDLKNGNYKITINKEQKKNFTVGVTMELYNENHDMVDETEAGVWVQSKEEYPQEQGFVAIADLDRENPVIPTDINWYSNIGAYYTDEVCIVFATIDSDESINIVTADQLSLTDSEGNPVGSITANAKDSRFCDLTFPGIGSYKVVNKETKEVVNLDVYYREVAFYKNTTVSKDSYLSSVKTDSDNQVFYMVENQGEDYIIKNVELHAGIYEDGKEEPTYFTDSTKYFTYEVVNASEPYVYKVTLGAKADLPEEFFIEVKAQIQDAYGTYDTDGYVWIYTDKDSSDSGNTGGGSSGGSTGGGSTVTPTPEPTPTPAPGETTTETKTETTTNSSGNTVKQETTTIKNSDGSVASTTTKSEIENVAKNTSASVTVTKDADGKISAAEAEVENTVATGTSDKVKTTISANVVKQMTDAAGTTDLTIKQTVKDEKGNVLYTVETKAEDLAAGKKLTLVKIEDGKKVLVSKAVTVNKSGNVSVKAEEGEYQLLNEKETKALQKEILKTVTPKKSNVSISKGKKTTVKLSSKLDMDNVAKITYTSSNKSTVKVDKNGKITAKKKGNVTVKVKVTLNDGTTKTVKVKVKVK